MDIRCRDCKIYICEGNGEYRMICDKCFSRTDGNYGSMNLGDITIGGYTHSVSGKKYGDREQWIK